MCRGVERYPKSLGMFRTFGADLRNQCRDFLGRNGNGASDSERI